MQKRPSWTGWALAWTWVAAIVALVGAWAVTVLTEVMPVKPTTFVILWGLASAGPVVATVLWVRAGRARSSGEEKDQRPQNE